MKPGAVILTVALLTNTAIVLEELLLQALRLELEGKNMQILTLFTTPKGQKIPIYQY